MFSRLFTERAHLMCPRMTFGIALSVGKPFDGTAIKDTFTALAEAHPFLQALVAYDEAESAYSYQITEQEQTELLLFEDEATGIEDARIIHQYEALTARDWDVTREGLLKAAAWPLGGGTVFLLAVHHLLTDGRGALGLACELADCYVKGEKPRYAPESIITAEDLPKGSELPFISRMLVRRANRQWEKEGHVLAYEDYHRAADAYLSAHPAAHTLTVVPPEELGRIYDACHQSGVTVNDWLLARTFREENTRKVIMAYALRSTLNRPLGPLGNCSTAFSIVYNGRTDDTAAMAKTIHSLVQKKANSSRDLFLVLQCYASLNGSLLDAAWASCEGGFDSKAGRFIGSVFFGFGAKSSCSVTNLGKIESDTVDAACFIPPASPAIRKTLGVLTVNGRMVICTSE